MDSNLLLAILFGVLFVVSAFVAGRRLDVVEDLEHRVAQLSAARISKTRELESLRRAVESYKEERIRLLEAQGVTLEFHLVANTSVLEIVEADDTWYKASTQGALVAKTHKVPLIKHGVASREPLEPGLIGKHLSEAILDNMRVI